MGTQGPGRKRIPNREKLTAEDDALNQIAREAEARLAAKRAARAEAREIRMKELERQQKELFHSHKKYYGLDNKWGHIEQWMEDSERYSRLSRRHASISDDEERMSVGSRGSLRVSPHHHVDLVSVSRPPSDYSGFLGSSSRASSRASSARASPVVEERPDRDFLDKGSRTASTLSAATLASLGGASSRRGSCDTSFSVETEASIREIKDSLVEAEDRYRKAMVSNAQLHNDKSTLMYQVDTLREELSDMEEELWEARRHCDHTTKELERERQAHKVLQFQFKEMKETLKQMEELLTKHAVIVSPDVSTNGEAGQGEVESDVGEQSDSRLAEEPLRGGRESMLEMRLKKVFEERESLQDQVRLLKSQLDQRQKNGTDGVQNPEEDDLENGMDSHLLDLQRDANRQISDLKFKLVKSEQEVTALEQNIIRLEGQVTRYKSASESAEKIEDELKVEKRKLQRELRSALDRVDELEVSNSHLSKRLEKMKANRSALLAQQ
ncbi:leucine-rich repeat flightless-interacting protein 2-like isoform X13 [Seriola lalandi dorsalis]|uniref:leucine-rich repeat flightless-interacting protein 2-like isoform X13 n=1 Tax=Seriola lalandi dorsalis TaxID=1841481 RepID=UPI000C6F75F0|nr:leucine-rich repeat flightless-interacting protein 2-like isoform X13 [Seriola lalandi dorsalis]XP_056226991.1 leucine-rich repeat flightless-interacting protein 2 isoform X12 [Seriola aureovittata]